MEVRTERGGGSGDWLVRQAETDDEAIRLRREAGQLQAAAHPGVVELGTWTDAPPIQLRTRLAGRPLTDISALAAAEVCGLGAAVATVLADLHDIGVVHGHLRPEHILVGPDGRPVLCGFGSATTAEDGDAAGDVRDLAGILAERLGTDAPRRLTSFLGRAGAGGRREVSARALASRLGDLVPDRRLPGVEISGVARASGTDVGPSAEGSPTLSGVIRRHPLRLAAGAPSPGPGPEMQPEPDERADSGHRDRSFAQGGNRRVKNGRVGNGGVGNGRVQSGRVGNGGVESGRVGSSAQRGSRRPIAAGAVVLVVVAGAIGLWLVGRPTASRVACPGTDAGCGPVRLRQGELVTTAGRFVIELPDPVVVLGRWGCSGISLPAALDRRTGQVWAWRDWAPSRGGVRATPVTTTPGASSLRVVPGRTGCDRLDVIGPGGSSAIVRPWGDARA